METYLVGGAVRDDLLGIEVSERDYVVVGATEAELTDAGFRSVGKDFPVYLHPETGDEYALARTERRTGRGHRAFECHTDAVTLEEDLSRRDLTINAIARDEEGQLIDLVGGVTDLENRVLRHISPAFAEDPLRILRVARFAARFADRGFQIADETRELMIAMVNAGELEDLTPERVMLELDKVMATGSPRVFFEVIEQIGGRQVLWPELDANEMSLVQSLVALSDDVRYRLCATLSGTSLDEGLAFLNRYRAPNRTIELFRANRQFEAAFEIAARLASDEAVNMLSNLDAFRQPDRFMETLEFTTLMAGARGSGGDEQNQWWKQAHQALAGVSRADVDPALQGPAIGEAIHAARIERLEQVR